MKIQKNSEKGQTLVIIVILMILALAIGVSISTRFLKTLRFAVEGDNATKALNIAEAAVERVLVLPYSTLEEYINFNSCGSSCTLTIPDDNGQQISANVSLSFTGNSTDPYPMELTMDNIRELSLASYPTNQNVYVCWNGGASVYGSYIYDDSGTIRADAYAFNSVTSVYSTNDFSYAYAAYGYQNCFTVTARRTPKLLRLKSIYENAEVSILPAPGQTIPTQGIRIESIGNAGDATKKVVVIKTNAYVPVLFDYVIYQRSETETLSN